MSPKITFALDPTQEATRLKSKYRLMQLPIDAREIFIHHTQLAIQEEKPAALDRELALLKRVHEDDDHRTLFVRSGIAKPFLNYLAAMALGAEVLELPGPFVFSRREIVEGAVTVQKREVQTFADEFLISEKALRILYESERFTVAYAAGRFQTPHTPVIRRMREFKLI